MKAQSNRSETHRAESWHSGFVRLVTAIVAILLCLAPLPGRAAGFETKAPTAILIDFATGKTLVQKDTDREIPPASLAKLMTIAVVFDALKSGEISRDQTFTVSRKAWSEGGASSGGSTMFLPLNSQVSIDDLIKGIIIQSGNDATIVVAEGMTGSTEAFARRMNAEARKIGLTHSHFTNPHGLPDPDQHVTMRDLAKLAVYLIKEFPEDYPIFAQENFKFNKINQRNRNPLLPLGADGLKTGYTDQAGYGLVASAKRNGRRIVLAMGGMASDGERASEARRLMEYGLQDFEEVSLVSAGKTVGTAAVRGGVQREVELAASNELKVLVPSGSLADVTKSVHDNGPVAAPVAKGQRLGWARFFRDDELVAQVPLLATTDVARANLVAQIGRTVMDHFTWHGGAWPGQRFALDALIGWSSKDRYGGDKTPVRDQTDEAKAASGT